MDGVLPVAGWLRMGSNYCKVLNALKTVITNNVDFVVSEEPPNLMRYAEALKEFMLSQFLVFNSVSKRSKPEEKASRSMAEYTSNWENHLIEWRCAFETQAGRIVVYVPAPMDEAQREDRIDWIWFPSSPLGLPAKWLSEGFETTPTQCQVISLQTAHASRALTQATRIR